MMSRIIKVRDAPVFNQLFKLVKILMLVIAILPTGVGVLGASSAIHAEWTFSMNPASLETIAAQRWEIFLSFAPIVLIPLVIVTGILLIANPRLIRPWLLVLTLYPAWAGLTMCYLIIQEALTARPDMADRNLEFALRFSPAAFGSLAIVGALLLLWKKLRPIQR